MARQPAELRRLMPTIDALTDASPADAAPIASRAVSAGGFMKASTTTPSLCAVRSSMRFWVAATAWSAFALLVLGGGQLRAGGLQIPELEVALPSSADIDTGM
jgi:hypothetical protein